MPAKLPKRQAWLIAARVAGYHHDSAAYTRLRVEARVAPQYLAEEWHRGIGMKAQGVPCDCSRCKEARDA